MMVLPELCSYLVDTNMILFLIAQKAEFSTSVRLCIP